MRWARSQGLDRQLSELTGAVTRVESTVKANARVAEEVNRSTLSQLLSLDRRVDDVRAEVTAQRESSEAHMREHKDAKNPHPALEEWVNERFAALGKEITHLADRIGGLTEQISTWRGSLRVIGGLYVIVAAVGTALLTKAFGG